jgi:hypothetical protein
MRSLRDLMDCQEGSRKFFPIFQVGMGTKMGLFESHELRGEFRSA